MQLSRKISALKPSPTVALNGRAKAMIAEGINVTNLSVGEPDFATPEVITFKAIEALNAGKTKYGPAGGGAPLKQAIVNKLKRENNLDFSPNDVVVGIGAKELLFHISLAMLNEGDEVILPAPYWVSYAAHCDAVGAKAAVVPMGDDANDVFLTPEKCERYATKNTRAIILNSPNNPGGFVYSRDQLQELADYLVEKDWWIISDEIYEYLSFDQEHVSLLELRPELKDRFILVHGLSKGFAMTGWRVGYCCGPAPIMKLVKTLQSQSSTCLPPFIEAAAVFALDSGKALMSKELEILKNRRDLVVKLASEIEGISFTKPTGAFYLFIDLRKRLAGMTKMTDATSMAFSEYLLNKHHIAMVPGEAFGAPGFIRMSYAANDNSLRRGLLELKLALNALT